MKSKNLRQNILYILAFSALASLLCTFATGFGILYWGRSSSLEHTANEAKIIANGEIPKFVSGLLLSDEFGGVALLTQRIKERFLFDSVTVDKSLDISAISTDRSQRCDVQYNSITCLDYLGARYLIALPISIPDRTLGWIKISGHDRKAVDLAKLVFPIGILLIGFLLSALVSGFWIWRYIGNTIKDALQTLSESAASNSIDSSSDTIPKFAIEELNVLGAHMQALLNRLQQARANDAIARMTQMLAHDVRRPFSIFKMGLSMFSNAKDMNAVKIALARVTPEVDRAVSSVNGLIEDVMEVGSPERNLIVEPVMPQSLIEITIGDLCQVYPKLQTAFTYDLGHTHKVSAHIQKITRVFSNIVSNSAQAMKFKGTMWFKTKDILEDEKPFVEFCIGNYGSFIHEQDLAKLFEAFFTSGRKNGTGLGLAIAKKVVVAHGGRIWCESSKSEQHPEGKVEFYFTLPADGTSCSSGSGTLPNHSSDVLNANMALAAQPNGRPERANAKGESALEIDIINVSYDLGRPISVLIVDDEPIYRHVLINSLGRTPELARSLKILQADGAEQAIGALSANSFDLIITDIDMGPESMDGIELVGALRKEHNFSGAICVHSNRILSSDQKLGLEKGANSFAPKPLSRTDLLSMVIDAASAVN